MTAALQNPTTIFSSPDDRTATAPAEYRGLARDQVRLLVASPAGIVHARFRDLPQHLRAGDLLVVNNSGTLPAELDGHWLAGRWWCTWRPISGTAVGWLNCAPRRTLGLPS